MHPTTHAFPENARKALSDERLQGVLNKTGVGFIEKRRAAAARLPEFEALRDQARDMKNHVLANLDLYLEAFEARVTERGGEVHWCRTDAEAREAILRICQQAGARTVTKGKSMISEEIGINPYLEANGMTPVETDLGEYIIQLRNEPPSHIIAPAVHLSKEDVAETFRAAHTELPPDRPLTEPTVLVAEARRMLRQKFLAADVGITGANMMVAETGSTIIVTNEGNGDLTQTLPRVHIVLASIDKVVPTLEDATLVLRVLARSATGQEASAYTTVSTGPRRPGDLDGPEQFHVVLLDNGRSALLGTEFQDVLRCIRCGACMNHCPVYGAVGGHAYGWVYPGPIGSVMQPALLGVEEAGHLPNASTFCGRCEAVCPMRIPLPKMMRHWREKEFEAGLQPPSIRKGLSLWGWFARRPALYHAATRMAVGMLGRLARGKGRFASLPLARGWTAFRDMPAPQGETFQQQWAKRRAATTQGTGQGTKR
ncbi:LutB/LldF family L-lactate oxidation iron-sulfur protein [Azospirillum thermophilum]|uniref:Iron-sulfur cluster-binding protein n=1 Tax=Azospirillum thermophilum TaxID=2202148 RepID=A0A2S2CN15_9PROT|nr:LutB/LldF family L-lactate oxidation iron-sulfur protein [Azospirillum thermophilum]AWK85901.1 iron-sulfur cluster-binding protein [Azospirillum thermophilum]